MSQPTVAAGFVRALLDYTVDRGVDRAKMLDAVGLAPADLAVQDARVPLAAYHGLIATAIRETGDSALLLRHTLETRLETMSIVGQIVHSSGSMLHSMAQLNRYSRLMADVDIMKGADKRELERKRGKKPVKDEPPKSPEPKVAGFPAANRQIVSKAQQTRQPAKSGCH